MAEIRKDRDKFIGRQKVQIVSWNPAFALIDLKFKEQNEIVEDLHIHSEAGFILKDELKEFRGAEKSLPEDENHWEVEIEKIGHNRLGSPGPNHCGLDVKSIRQLRLRDHMKEKSSTFLDKILPWR